MIVDSLKPLAVPLNRVRLDPENARLHNEGNLATIRNSLLRFGQRKPIVADLETGIVEAGNGTLMVAAELGWKEIAVVWVKDDKATAKAYAIADNRSAELATWDVDRLEATLDWLAEEVDFPVVEIGFTDDQIAALKDEAPARDDLYTKKIQAPIYEPKGERPSLASLVDLSKAQKLIDEISQASLPDDVAMFLSYAARRHAVFDYEAIAEYYAHAPKEVQELMERSALVIIDFDKALENGFVALSEALAEAYKDGP